MSTISHDQLRSELQTLSDRVNSLFFNLRNEGVRTPDLGTNIPARIQSILSTIGYRISQIDANMSRINEWIGEPKSIDFNMKIAEIIALSIYATVLRGGDTPQFLKANLSLSRQPEILSENALRYAMQGVESCRQCVRGDNIENKHHFAMGASRIIEILRYTHGMHEHLFSQIDRWFCEMICIHGTIPDWNTSPAEMFQHTLDETDESLIQYLESWEKLGVVEQGSLFSHLKKRLP